MTAITTPRPPATLPVNARGIPEELKVLPHWMCWRWEYRPEAKKLWTKPPVDAKSGTSGSSTNPATWAPFKVALEYMERHNLPGVGIVPTEDVTLLDLDNCRDANTEQISPWAMEIVNSVPAYWEISPSGTGLRGLVRAVKPAGACRKQDFEMYAGGGGRYVTVTGQRLPQSANGVPEAQEAVDALHAQFFPPKEGLPAAQPHAVGLDDAQLIERAMNARNGTGFQRLWQGDWSAYGSQSEADLALASMLMFWTGNDTARADSLFHQSGLMRPKWDDRHFADGRTYGQATLEEAMQTQVYDPRPSYIPHGMKIAPAPPEEMAPEAYYGVAGDIVQALDPHTEASKPALLLSFLDAVGNAIGRGPHAKAEADRHGTNLFTVLVGDTSKGRKGSSWGHIRELLNRVDPTWAKSRIQGGMASGEGLLWAVRDPIEKSEPVKDKGKATGEYQTSVVDPGVDDKRLLAYEPEFASVLKVMLRESNTVSTQSRQAWDTGDLRTMTKSNPATATDAHISILGHITKDELLRYLTDTEAGNGFANRFLWGYTRRSKVLPDGGGEPDYQKLVPMLHDALERARKVERLSRDAEATEAWAEVYPDLSEGQPGLFGDVTARSEAQVLRLSVLYAALDGAIAIRLPHLKAALAVWEYCEASARWIFGDATGDPIADQILTALTHGEISRTAISNLFGRNVSSGRIAQALNLLLKLRRAQCEQRSSDDGKGRPVEVWSRI